MKTVVSIPDDVSAGTERLAWRTNRSRSRLLSDALKEYLARHTPDKVTEAMNTAGVLVLTGSGGLKAFPTVPTTLISLGGFCVGLGEWINHPLQTSLLPPSAYHAGGVLTGHARRASLTGSAFLILGLILIGWGVLKLFRA